MAMPIGRYCVVQTELFSLFIYYVAFFFFFYIASMVVSTSEILYLIFVITQHSFIRL